MNNNRRMWRGLHIEYVDGYRRVLRGWNEEKNVSYRM